MLKSKFCLLLIVYFKRVYSKSYENSTYLPVPKIRKRTALRQFFHSRIATKSIGCFV